MQLTFKIKSFNELSLTELYNVLQLRSEVFVVEQNCVYQDIDGKDEKAIHLSELLTTKLLLMSEFLYPAIILKPLLLAE